MPVYKRRPKFHRKAIIGYNRLKYAINQAYDAKLKQVEIGCVLASQMNTPSMRDVGVNLALEVKERDDQIAALTKPRFTGYRR